MAKYDYNSEDSLRGDFFTAEEKEEYYKSEKGGCFGCLGIFLLPTFIYLLYSLVS